MKHFALSLFFILSPYVSAASFDCAKAASAIEKQICANPTISQLDGDLGSVYKRARSHNGSSDKIKQEQRSWLKNVRNRCNDDACLEKTYKDRIQVLSKMVSENEAASKKTSDNFKISFNFSSDKLCDEYLKVLNSTDRADLKACELPDLDESPISIFPFTSLSGDELEKTDQQVFFLNHPDWKGTWQEAWAKRKEEYRSGYRTLGKAYWDYDKDGIKDVIIEEKIPWLFCIPFGVDKLDKEVKRVKNSWPKMTAAEQKKTAKANGFKRAYYIIKSEKISYLSANNLVLFKDEVYSIIQYNLNMMNAIASWGHRNWVLISSLNTAPEEDINVYKSYEICRFWLN